MMKRKLKLLLLAITLIAALIPYSANAAADLTVVPYAIDSSNQAGWWSPLATYGTGDEYAYMAYNEGVPKAMKSG